MGKTNHEIIIYAVIMLNPILLYINPLSTGCQLIIPFFIEF